MKKETNIAKKKLKEYKKEGNKIFSCERRLDYLKAYIDNHLASCQRFLEFLDNLYGQAVLTIGTDKEYVPIEINNKIKDLQDAIKVYEDGGV